MIGATTVSESLWSVQDVARYLGMSRSWVYRQAEAGELPHIKLGHAVRFVPDQIRHYAAQHAKSNDAGAKVIQLKPKRGDS